MVASPSGPASTTEPPLLLPEPLPPELLLLPELLPDEEPDEEPLDEPELDDDPLDDPPDDPLDDPDPDEDPDDDPPLPEPLPLLLPLSGVTTTSGSEADESPSCAVAPTARSSKPHSDAHAVMAPAHGALANATMTKALARLMGLTESVRTGTRCRLGDPPGGRRCGSARASPTRR
jgi:hypothetical protein